jgi:hypothetical protein
MVENAGTERLMSAFLERITDQANELRAKLLVMAPRGMGAVIRGIAENDVVVAVWQRPTEPYGIGWLVIKGHQVLREMSTMALSMRARVFVVVCVEEEQAIALLEMHGERRDSVASVVQPTLKRCTRKVFYLAKHRENLPDTQHRSNRVALQPESHYARRPAGPVRPQSLAR